VQRVVYKPFGDTASGQAPAFGFTGQRFEANLGIYDYGARWYDPALGRFLSADAVVEAPYNPQTFNRYSYVRNSPTNRVDPTGNTSFWYEYEYGWSPGWYAGVIQERYEYLSSPVYWGGTDLGLTDLPPAFIVIPEGGGVVIDLEALAAGLASEYEMMWQSYEYEMMLREARRQPQRPSLLDAPRTGSGSSESLWNAVKEGGSAQAGVGAGYHLKDFKIGPLKAGGGVVFGSGGVGADSEGWFVWGASTMDIQLSAGRYGGRAYLWDVDIGSRGVDNIDVLGVESPTWDLSIGVGGTWPPYSFEVKYDFQPLIDYFRRE
jgi:RHS repeat-associated protein